MERPAEILKNKSMPGYKYTEEECSKMLAALKKLKKHKKYF